MKIQNRHIPLIIKFIDNMNLKGRESLGRTKLKEKLVSQNEVINTDQVAIVDEFEGWTDKNKGQFTTANKEQNEAMDALLTAEVEIGHDSPFHQDFVEALENYDSELSGQEADIYALLFESLTEENEEEK